MKLRGTHRVRCVAEVLQRIASRAEEIEMDLDRRSALGENFSKYDLDCMSLEFSHYLLKLGWGSEGCVGIRYDTLDHRHEVRMDIAAVCTQLAVCSSLQWLPT